MILELTHSSKVVARLSLAIIGLLFVFIDASWIGWQWMVGGWVKLGKPNQGGVEAGAGLGNLFVLSYDFCIV